MHNGYCVIKLADLLYVSRIKITGLNIEIFHRWSLGIVSYVQKVVNVMVRDYITPVMFYTHCGKKFKTGSIHLYRYVNVVVILLSNKLRKYSRLYCTLCIHSLSLICLPPPSLSLSHLFSCACCMNMVRQLDRCRLMLHVASARHCASWFYPSPLCLSSCRLCLIHHMVVSRVTRSQC